MSVQRNSSTGFTLKKQILRYQYNGKRFMMYIFVNALDTSSFEYAVSIRSSQIKIDFLLGGNNSHPLTNLEYLQ